MQRGGAVGALYDQLGQVTNRDFLIVAHVHHLAPGLGTTGEAVQGDHGVAHIAEGARLSAFAVDGQRLVVDRLFDECWHHHAVVAHLVRSDGVEQAGDHDIEAVFARIGKGEELVRQLGHGISPAQTAGGRQHDVVGLGKAVLFVEAVYLRGRGDDDLRVPAAMVNGAQESFGAGHVGCHHGHRVFQHFFHANDRGHVVDAVRPGDGLVETIPMQDVGLGEAKGGIAAERVEVCKRTGAQVVHHINLVAVRQMAFCQMRSDEACAARDQNMHIVCLRIFASACRTINRPTMRL